MRTWVVLLALANVAFFVWTSGWMSPWLPAPWEGQREPKRQANQLNPELVAVRRIAVMPAAQQASGVVAASEEAPAAASGPAGPAQRR